MADGGRELAEQRCVHQAAGLIDRGERGVLDLSSAKSPVGKFLQGILSSAVDRLSPGQGQPSTLLSSRGRLIVAFHLHALAGGDFRLVLLEPLRESVVQAIRKYAFLSNVDLTDRSRQVAILGVEGPLAASALERACGARVLPAEPLASCSLELGGVPLQAVRGGETPEGGYELWVPRPALEAARERLLSAVQALGGGAVGVEAAEALRIEAGLARHGLEYQEDSFPAEVGWEHALTYDKCYVGQEVVARMKTYGSASRRLRGVLFPPAPGGPDAEPAGGLSGWRLPAPGSPLSVGGEEVGVVTSAARSARLGRVIGLALVKRKHWGAESAVIQLGEGAVEAALVDLPLVRCQAAEREDSRGHAG